MGSFLAPCPKCDTFIKWNVFDNYHQCSVCLNFISHKIIEHMFNEENYKPPIRIIKLTRK